MTAGLTVSSPLLSPLLRFGLQINIYRSSSQLDIISYCQRNRIAVQAYSPFGVPDYHPYPSPLPAANQLEVRAAVCVRCFCRAPR